MGNPTPMKRLFVAAWPDDDARTALAPVDRWLEGLGATHRAVPQANRHVTIAFLGDVPADRIDAVAAAVREACRGVGASAPGMTGVVALPRPGEARVLAVALEGPSAVTELMRRVAAGALGVWESAALRRSLARPALAHVTVARARGGGRAGAVDLSRSPRGPLGVFRVESVSLVCSTLTPAGAEYEEIGVAALRGDA